MNDILVNGGIILANCIATSLISAGTQAIIGKKIAKEMREFDEADKEVYEKEKTKRCVKAALLSTAITTVSAAGMAFGSAILISDLSGGVPAIETTAGGDGSESSGE